MAHQFRRGAQDDSSDESDDDYVPPEQVEVEDEGSDSAGADLEPSSGADTDLDIGKRKRKRKVRARNNTRTKKRLRTDDTSDNNDETTSNETLLSLPLKFSTVGALSSGTSSKSGDQSSTPSPGGTGPTSSSEPPSLINSRFSTGRTSKITSMLASHSGTVFIKEFIDISSAPAPAAASASKSGLGSMLAKLSAKKKPTTLEKSQMDWQQFKSANQIEGELLQHNKGKGGFLDRKDFLERANVREFEFGQKSKSASSRHD